MDILLQIIEYKLALLELIKKEIEISRKIEMLSKVLFIVECEYRQEKENNKENNKDNCCICLEKKENTYISRTSCGHTFHSKCLLDYFISVEGYCMKCPLCRNELYI